MRWERFDVDTAVMLNQVGWGMQDVKVRVHVEQLSVYLLRDGTVLSFSQDTGFHGRLSGIFGRIASRDDILRGSEDGKSA